MKINLSSVLGLPLLWALFAACGGGTPSVQQNSDAQGSALLREAQISAFQFAEAECFSCHGNVAPGQRRLAPRMDDILAAYTKEFPDSAQRAQAILSYATAPARERALMSNSVDQYGIMGPVSTDPEKVRLIVEFLMQQPVEQASWFDSEYSNWQVNAIASIEQPQQRAQRIMLHTKAALASQLMQAIAQQGITEAVQFCSLEALPITQAQANVHGVQIRRVSDLNRNAQNAANVEELAYMDQVRLQPPGSESYKPMFADDEDGTTAYFPIYTDNACLQCHGVPDTQIATATLQRIRQLYPEDKATGYQVGELRGLWVIRLPK